MLENIYMITKERLEELLETEKKYKDLDREFFDWRDSIYLDRYAIPHKLTKDKSFMELYDMPSYEYLYDMVEEYKQVKEFISKYKSMIENDMKMLSNMILTDDKTYTYLIDQDLTEIMAINKILRYIKKIEK